jgi:cytochrome c
MSGSGRFQLLVILALILAPIAAVFAADRGTPAEARAMLLKAIAYYKSVGRKQALADFTASKPPFRDRDLFVFCLGPDHTVVANGGFPRLVGVKEGTVVDSDGKSVAAIARRLISSDGEAVVRYRWINPMTHNVELKITFFAKAGDDICGVGAYSAQ